MSFAFAVVSLLANIPAKGEPNGLATKAGAVFAVPDGFKAFPKEHLPYRGAGPRESIAHALRKEVGNSIVWLWVYEMPLPPGEAQAGLPKRSGRLPQWIAEEMVAGRKEGLPPGSTLVSATSLLYDHERRALGVENRFNAYSSARELLEEPESSPYWKDSATGPGARRVNRCVVSAVCDAYEAGKPAAAARMANERCGVPTEGAETFIRQATPVFFQPRRILERQLWIITFRGISVARLEADESLRKPLEAAWGQLWRRSRVSRDETRAP